MHLVMQFFIANLAHAAYRFPISSVKEKTMYYNMNKHTYFVYISPVKVVYFSILMPCRSQT